MKAKSTLRAFLLGGPLAVILASSAQATTYYWDNDGATAGFGTAGGTWAAPTTGDATQGWSTDATGATLPANITTANTDSLNFGNLSTGLAAGTITLSGTVDSGNLTFASGSGAVVLSGGTLNLAAVSTITINNAADTIGSVLQGAATSLTKSGTGQMNLSGANTYTGTTTINGGIARLDFNAAGAPQDHIINNATNSSALSVRGGQLTLTGSATLANQQRFNGLSVTGGSNTLALNANGTTPKNLLLSLGAITRSSAGSTVNFSLPQGTAGASNGITTSSTNTLGILGGWAVVGNNNWAINNGTNNIASLGTYTTTTTTAADYTDNNMDVVGSNTVVGLISTNSLRFSGATARTLTLAAGDNIVQSGGILVRSDVGNNLSTITGGNLAGSASGDLIIHQANTSNGLTIGSLIQNNSGATALTKSGTGLLTLSVANTYTGGTFINAGTVAISADSRLGDAAGGITFGGSSTLFITGAVTSARQITLNTNVTATFQGAAAYTNSEKVTGAGGISFTTSGTTRSFLLSNTGNDFTGAVSVDGNASGQGNTVTFNSLTDSAGTGNISIGSCAGGVSGGASVVFNYGSGATGVLNLNNRRINLIGNGSNTNATGATFSNLNTSQAVTINTDLLVSGPNGKLTLSAVAGPTNVFAGKITNSGSTGGVIINKAGAGTWTLSGDNSFSGGLTLSAGKLNINSATALGIGTFSVGAATFDNTSGSALTLTPNNLQAWNGDFTFTGTNSLNLGTGAVTLGGTRNITTSANTLTVGGDIGSSAGVITTAGIQKTTGGGTLVFNGNNTYSGATSVSAGKLQIGNSNALGYGGLQTTATNGTTASTGTLDLNGITGVNEPITINGTGVSSGGALINNSGSPAGIGNGIAGLKLLTATTGTGYSTAPTITISGTGTGATATTILGVTTQSFTIAVSGDRNYTVAPVVTIGGGSSATATPVLSGGTTGTVTGITVTASGTGFSGVPTAVISGGTSTGTTTSTFTGNATNFTVSGVRMTAAGSGYTGTPTYTFGSGDAVAGTATLSSVTLINATNNSIGGTGNTTIDAVVSDGGSARALTKVGAGTLTLTAANTYTGATTVSVGTLALVNGSQASPITVSSGASLAFTLGSPTTSTSSFDLSAGTIKITGTPTLASYTLITSSTGITGTPTLDSPISGYALQVDGTALKLVQTGGNTYATWIATYPGAAALPGFTDDADGDGIKNGVENFFGTNPGTFSTGLVVGTVSGNTFTFTHPQNATPASDLSAAYLWSKDLATFNASGATDGAGTTVTFTTQLNTPAPGITTVTATVTGTATTKLFADVKVTKN